MKMRLLVAGRFVHFVQPRVVGFDWVFYLFAVPSPLMLAIITDKVRITVGYLATAKNYSSFFDAFFKLVIKRRHTFYDASYAS